jgi:hypothetical protein
LANVCSVNGDSVCGGENSEFPVWAAQGVDCFPLKMADLFLLHGFPEVFLYGGSKETGEFFPEIFSQKLLRLEVEVVCHAFVNIEKVPVGVKRVEVGVYAIQYVQQLSVLFCKESGIIWL